MGSIGERDQGLRVAELVATLSLAADPGLGQLAEHRSSDPSASDKQIALELGMAPKTAGSHVEHIHTKLGVSTRAAALFAIQHGPVPALRPLELR